MKTTTVRALTDAADAIQRALDTYADSPVAITLTYLDESGRVVVAQHVAGVPGWTLPHADNDVPT